MKRNCIFQVSTTDFLLKRNYSGFVSIKQLLKHGDFGIGTFSGLDGEMIMLGGKIYRANHSGEINEVKSSKKTPFAISTFFAPKKDFPIENAGNKDLTQIMLKQFIISDYLYAIKIAGFFQMIDLRSGKKQQKPYPEFKTLTKSLSQFKLEHIEGTIVGFYFPESYKKISGNGFHFHFIDKKFEFGGHVNDFYIDMAKVEIEIKTRINLKLFNPSPILKPLND